MQDCKDGSGLQFIKFDFVTGGKKKITFYSSRILSFFWHYFVFLVHISLRSSLLAVFSSCFKIIKKA